MIQSIIRIIINGTVGIFIFRIIYLFFGKYIVFAFYHINFGLYWVCQTFLDPQIIKAMSLVIIGWIMTLILKKLGSIVSV